MNDPTIGLKKDDLEENNPIALFEDWLALANKHESNDPSAMALASVDADGMPNVRMVLMRRHDERGFVFFTNFESQKGEELLGQNKAAACFHWKSIRKSVRIRGLIEVVSDEEADEYFFSRPLGSRIGAWASKQSRELESRFALEKQVAKYTAKFGISKIPRPQYWSGFRIMPLSIEFWSDGKFRLHDRFKYDRTGLDQPWSLRRLYP
ncbi:MAG: pyridoxamine 5'-phosphate oxidase [Gammaproteobacteria bacterium]|nr:pyridoxamine 5'-phosphate oxidase [Gammaproteobacteria bacterium]